MTPTAFDVGRLVRLRDGRTGRLVELDERRPERLRAVVLLPGNREWVGPVNELEVV